ncbi:ComEA family DNA-binding protein [Desulfonatronovibrio hydrogenovorans]|uniref:ComEA family DNA-binding protein n=1 Tax=Desulfonatronovibrio hydrogenovorans TaxID=53245 RepID=UPI000689ED3D|nr:ComEA family DNA-binding protein [Desulfonatronovibrio hydrogenovorans]
MKRSFFITAIILLSLLFAPVAGLSSTQININTADAEQLTSLPGIGPALAERIIDYRQEFPFTKTEDIMQVPGIGEVRYNEIKDLISIE